VSGFGKRYSSFDRFQQRHRWLGFPLAVLQKYADDQGGYLAASITYYAFFCGIPARPDLAALSSIASVASWASSFPAGAKTSTSPFPFSVPV
jgi:uncharacterized BrkB/YihY/UPF0761 family membrane protein